MLICLKDEVTHKQYGNGLVIEVNPPFVKVAFYKGRDMIVSKGSLTHV